MVQSIVANSLKEGLPDSQNGKMHLSIANSGVSGNLPFLPWNLHKRNILIVKVHLNEDRDKYLKRNINDWLNHNSNCSFLPFGANFDTFFVVLLDPPILLYVLVIAYHVIVLYFNLINKFFNFTNVKLFFYFGLFHVYKNLSQFSHVNHSRIQIVFFVIETTHLIILHQLFYYFLIFLRFFFFTSLTVTIRLLNFKIIPTGSSAHFLFPRNIDEIISSLYAIHFLPDFLLYWGCWRCTHWIKY